MNYSDFVKLRFKDGNAMLADLPGAEALSRLHALLGLITEVQEYLLSEPGSDNEIEELGDLEFYLEAFYQAIGSPFAEQLEERAGLDASYIAMATTVCEGLELVKKEIAYCKPLTLEMQNAYIDIYCKLRMAIAIAEVRAGQSIWSVTDANMAKLRKRYPIGYSNKDAQERKDKAECQQ